MPTTPTIRVAISGDEAAIHEAHMRSIREVCIKDHGEEEVRGWGNRPLGSRWTEAIKEGYVWVVEFQNQICGHGYIKITAEHDNIKAHIFGLYLTPEVLHQGFGFKLATLMIQKAKEWKAKSITLDASITGHEFYKKLGFKDVGPMTRSEFGGSLVSSFPMILHL